MVGNKYMAKYEITYGKFIQVGDIIIHDQKRCLVFYSVEGKGSGCIWGTYISMKVKDLESGKDLEFWYYTDLPVIKEKK